MRTPARDALLARAGAEIGHGRAFGLHEFLDQFGAVVGPVVVAAAVAAGGYRMGFAVLFVPAVAALVLLLRARGLEPVAAPPAGLARRLPGVYYRYLFFAVLTVLGFAHFLLVAYHLEATHRLAPAAIPLLFALAMGVDALAAVAVGRHFDRRRLRVLYALPFLTMPAVALLFLPVTPVLIWVGAALWGAALGIQESTMRAAVATLTAEAERGTAYGLFDTAFGTAWMTGSAVMGALYAIGPVWLVGFGLSMQVLALPLLRRVQREARASGAPAGIRMER